MARFSRLEVLNAIVETGLIPVFYHKDVEVAKKIVAACAAGGARLAEFTNRGDFAPQVFTELSQHLSKAGGPKVILGVGSIGAHLAMMATGHRRTCATRTSRRAWPCSPVGPAAHPAASRLPPLCR